MDIVTEEFGTFKETGIYRYTISNQRGMKVSILNFGAIISSLMVPDRQGELADVVLGYDTLDEYVSDSVYIGSLVGRYANRIKGGVLPIGESTYELACNRPGIHLHGGNEGFNKRVWRADTVREEGRLGLQLSLTSPDGDEGYPGKLEVLVSYFLTDDNELIIDYEAETDKQTVVNLTQHSYFNLAGKGDITGHHIEINSSRYTPVGTDLIPTGELAPVEGSPFDFRKKRRIGLAMSEGDVQKRTGEGFDHNYVLDTHGDAGKVAASILHQESGRTMEVCTTKPGMQLYTGNFLTERLAGRGGAPFFKHAALCLETQYYPDSPNQPTFPSPLLVPGDLYHHRTMYRFGLQK